MAEIEVETLEQQIARLEAQLEAANSATAVAVAQARAGAERGLHLKVSDKSAIQIVGMRGKFGLTLYLSEIQKVLEFVPTIKAFVLANADKIGTFDADHKPRIGLTAEDKARVSAWQVTAR